MAIPAITKAQQLSSSNPSSQNPKVIKTWVSRFPVIVFPGHAPPRNDTIRLGEGWESPPKALTLGGKKYPVKDGSAEVPKSTFPEKGNYPATVTLANGKNVPVTLDISLSF